MAADTSAATGIMIAGRDADGTATGMHTAVGAIPEEAKCITTPAMGSEVAKLSTAEASPTVAAVSTVDAAKR